MTEAELMNAIIEAARLLSWKCAHFRAARTAGGWRTPLQADAKGWPDLVMVRDRVVFAEVKVGRGRLSAEQEAWFGWLEAAGCELYLWREHDWLEGRIDQVLR